MIIVDAYITLSRDDWAAVRCVQRFGRLVSGNRNAGLDLRRYVLDELIPTQAGPQYWVLATAEGLSQDGGVFGRSVLDALGLLVSYAANKQLAVAMLMSKHRRRLAATGMILRSHTEIDAMIALNCADS